MKIDLHNHTILCNHAEGTLEEYIQNAIQADTKQFGFSDHAPMNFDKKYRMSFEQVDRYESDILYMKDKYRDEIEIFLGYEVDFLEGHMDERVLNANVDYLIGSVHFLEGWGFDNPEFIGEWKTQNIDEIWQKYFDTIESMANARVFDIVGHLDLIKVFKYMPKGDITTLAKRALEAIKDADMVLELNVAGYRKDVKEPYPSYALLKEAYKLGIPITFGSDAHKPEQVGLYSKEITALAKSVGYQEAAIFHKRDREMLKLD